MNRQLKQRIFSLFFGMWMAFTLVQPATAQWTVHINSDTSPTTFAMLQQMASQLSAQTSIAVDTKLSKVGQFLEYVKTAERWIRTVEHYSTQIIGDIRRFTSLKGILQTAERQLGLSDDTLKALADVGEIIRGSFTVKNQFLSLVRTRLSMIERLASRAKNGIFNPRADLEDLEEYLRYSIGREAAQRISLKKLKDNDPLLERLHYELEKVRAEIAAKEKELTKINEQLGIENDLQTNPRDVEIDTDGQSTTTLDDSRTSLSSDAIQTMTIRAGQLESQIIELKKQENSLLAEIQARYEKIQDGYDNAYLKGRYWNSVIDGWSDFDGVKKNKIEQMIDIYGNENSDDSPPIIPAN